MHRLSIIIPVSANVEGLEATLVSVLEKRPDDCEILVLLAAAYDDPYELAGEVRFVDVRQGAGLVEMLNLGVEHSAGDVLHFLASGCEVDEGWADAALARFEDPQVASVAPVVLNCLDGESIVAAGVRYSPWAGRVVAGAPRETASDDQQGLAADIVGPALIASFYRRTAFELAGGFDDAAGDLQADVDLGLVLRFAGYLAVLDKNSRVFAHPATVLSAPVGFRSGVSAEVLFWRAAPAAAYGALGAHALSVTIEFLKRLPTPAAFTGLLGRAWGTLQSCRYFSHRNWLHRVRDHVTATREEEVDERWRFDGPHMRRRIGKLGGAPRRLSA